MRKSMLIVIGLFILICSPLFAQNDPRRQPPDPFQRFFMLPGIELSQEQQAKVEELRKEFSPRLAEIQKKWNAIITQEQVQSRQEAFRKARQAGKEGQELRDAVDAAVKWTDEQRQQQAAIQE